MSSEIIFLIVTSIIGVITWPIFIWTVCEFDGTPMTKWDWILSIFFGLVPLVNIIPIGLVITLWLFVYLPTMIFNKLIHGKFKLDID